MKIKTQFDAVMHFIQQMDIEMLNDILDDKLTYEHTEKHLFINMLDTAFDTIKKGGNTILVSPKESCNNFDCPNKSNGYSFQGNLTGDHIDLIIIESGGVVKNIYECRTFSCDKKIEPTSGIKINLDLDYWPF